jgi:hypothetical protein
LAKGTRNTTSAVSQTEDPFSKQFVLDRMRQLAKKRAEPVSARAAATAEKRLIGQMLLAVEQAGRGSLAEVFQRHDTLWSVYKRARTLGTTIGLEGEKLRWCCATYAAQDAVPAIMEARAQIRAMSKAA